MQIFCIFLFNLQQYENIPFQDPLKKMTAKALIQIHVSFPSSAGVVDSCVERMKHIYVELHLESVKTGKSTHRRKVTEGFSNMIDSFNIRNTEYLLRGRQSQAVATELRLAAVLMALWPWFLLDDLCMTAVLELLCVYTANCTVGQSSESSGSVQAVLPKTVVTDSLMHGVMKLASQVAPDNSSIHSLAFSLLANLAISRDGKWVLLKSNFLQHFLSLPMPKAGGRSGSLAAESFSLWLKLLLNVSFGEDGQQMIFRLRGALEMLVGLALSKHSSSKATSLLILHNICFCSANKPKVLLLVSCLGNSSSEIRTIGASVTSFIQWHLVFAKSYYYNQAIVLCQRHKTLFMIIFINTNYMRVCHLTCDPSHPLSSHSAYLLLQRQRPL
uniref:Uncharacterized protein n=1 Tax=Cyprinus carpio TaxID=7962 RepID=A0A8C2IMX3_CYPCA